MTGTTISSYTTIGVVINAASQNPVSITSSGTIYAGSGYVAAVYAPLGIAGTVVNYGKLSAASGSAVLLNGGGTFTNGGTANRGASITANAFGIRMGARGAGTVSNYGTIITTSATTGLGIQLMGAGRVVNGSVSDTTAYIRSYGIGIATLGPNSSVYNYGTIVSLGISKAAYGIYLRAGGTITNGSNADTTATVIGNAHGVSAAIYASTIRNYGTIVTPASSPAGGGIPALLLEGGAVINGSNSDTVAYLNSGNGIRAVYIKGPVAGTVVNYGTISGGVGLRPGGTVVNGSSLDTRAVISGAKYGIGIVGQNLSTIVNYGTIIGTTQKGVGSTGPGTLTNGSELDRSARIVGQPAVYFGGTSPSYVTNYGTITQAAAGGGIVLALGSGGRVINGSPTDRVATIINGPGSSPADILITNGPGTVINYGTLIGGTGVSFYRGPGILGITMTGTGTVINAGTIASLSGTSGIAIRFGKGAEKLVIDPGSVIVGRVLGGSGSNLLELAAGGNGTLRGLGTSYVGFGTVQIDAGANWNLAGSNTVASGAVLTNSGSLSSNGSLVNAGYVAGALTATGIVLNQGTIGGRLSITAGGTLSNYGTIGSGGTALSFDGSGGLLQLGAGGAFRGNVSSAGNARLELLGGSSGTLSGLAGGAGTASSGGSWTFGGFYNTTVDRGASWTLAGYNTISTRGSVSVAGTLAAYGPLVISDPGTLSVTGATARLQARADLTLRGATLAPSGGAIEVGAVGSIVASGVVVDPGRTLSGYGTIAAPVIDNGTLVAQGGTLTVGARISGTGAVTIASGATLLAQGGVSESRLVFASGGNETLQVAKNTNVVATISGMRNTDTIDFLGTVGTSLTIAGGKLKVVGASGNVATLSFVGNYAVTNFRLSSDGHGGTNLTTVGLPAAVAAASPAPSAFATMLHDLLISAPVGAFASATAPAASVGGVSHDTAMVSSPVIAWHPTSGG